MTRLLNDPRVFAAQAAEGLVSAYPDHLVPVEGGVVRASAPPPGEVAVVLGGGSGHFPAFGGWVGPGLAHGAVLGDVFASPSASRVCSVARAADNGGGLLLGFGNYAGDVLHFGLAAERLRAEGVDVRVVTVTDDMASAPPDRVHDRRGIAGDLVVFKIAGAAAAAGLDLDGVERIAHKANDRTRTFGVALGGCTLPGAATPLFTVAPGRMALGLGIHGEPGIGEAPIGTADEVADRLLDGLLAEEPARGPTYAGRVAVLLNGLGATTYEELFVVHRRVVQRLEDLGLTPVAPVVGEQVTSLDMAGLSLTLTFLDQELERFWLAPVDAPTLRSAAAVVRRRVPPAPVPREAVTPGTASSRRSAGLALTALRAMAAVAAENEGLLGDLDAVAGDGDHGRGMVLGSHAAVQVAEELLARGAGLRTLLIGVGTAWSDGAGGTSGALWGAGLTAAGSVLSDERPPTAEDVVVAVENGADAVLRLGRARPGDKTLVDALVPFVAALGGRHRAGVPLAEAWGTASAEAHEAARSTSRMTARLGRAKTHGGRSIGSPDPGATSFALLMSAAVRAAEPTPTGGGS